MKIAVINYGMGNLASVRRALQDLGVVAYVADHPTALYEANAIVLPGVGAFAEGMARLGAGGWTDTLRKLVGEERRPVLGICLGMQLLATRGVEGGSTEGFGWIEGTVTRLDKQGCTLRVPHVGWNEVHAQSEDSLFAHIPPQSDFYFVHSYALEPADANDVVATTSYGISIPAAVRKQHVFGTQFHPEKSSRAGRQLLRNFLDFAPC